MRPVIEQSIEKWADVLEIPESTLNRWVYEMGLAAPFDNDKIITAISYGRGKAEKAKGASKHLAQQNLEKIERALLWL
jgi:endonuclease III